METQLKHDSLSMFAEKRPIARNAFEYRVNKGGGRGKLVIDSDGRHIPDGYTDSWRQL